MRTLRFLSESDKVCPLSIYILLWSSSSPVLARYYWGTLYSRLFFVHLDQNSGPLKTQVFTETQGIFPKTQGISIQIGVILVIFGRILAKIGRILPKLLKNPRKTQGKTLKTQVFGKAATAW